MANVKIEKVIVNSISAQSTNRFRTFGTKLEYCLDTSLGRSLGIVNGGRLEIVS